MLNSVLGWRRYLQVRQEDQPERRLRAGDHILVPG